MASAKSGLTREGTMQVTAKEGVQYLESEGKTKLLEMQGLKEPEKDEPGLKRDSTMAATAKEADVLLGKDRPDEDAKTRGQQTKIEEVKAESATAAKKPKMAKGVTMVGTAKEAAQILGDDKPDVDAMTRGQQKKIEEISKEPAPSPKKARLQKDGTMAATAKEAKAHILGKEKLGDTRQQTKASKPTAMKKTSSISKAIEEAKWVVPDLNVNEGRRTRSQSNPPKPGMKRAGTMQQTAAAGKEFLKRSKKSKKSNETVEEDEEEEEVA